MELTWAKYFAITILSVDAIILIVAFFKYKFRNDVDDTVNKDKIIK